MNKKIREWYTSTYPTDSLGYEISDSTFEDLFVALDNYQDVYDIIGVEDSIVRERCFSELSSIMGVEYSYIYNQWLRL